jgi:hypothetical protein
VISLEDAAKRKTDVPERGTTPRLRSVALVIAAILGITIKARKPVDIRAGCPVCCNDVNCVFYPDFGYCVCYDGCCGVACYTEPCQ